MVKCHLTDRDRDWSVVPFCSPPPAHALCAHLFLRRDVAASNLQSCEAIPSYGIKFRLRMTLPQAHFRNKKKPCVRRGRRRNECPVPFAAAVDRPCHERGRAASRSKPTTRSTASAPLLSVRGLGIRFKTSQGAIAGDARHRLRRCARRARRHRRRERLRQDHHRACRSCACCRAISRTSTARSISTASTLRTMQHKQAARGARPPHRDDLSGADECARSGVHRRPPDLRSAAHSHQARCEGGARKNHRNAAQRRHRLARASRRRLSAPALRRHAPACDDRRSA